MYPSEVGGVVLIDSMTPKQFAQSPTEAQSQSNSQSQSLSFPALLARFGVARSITLLMSPFIPSNEKAYYSRLVRTQNVQAFINEGQAMPAAGVQAAAVKTFGDLPLIVLTAKLNNRSGWQEWQAELLQLSSNSQQLFAENSGHNVQVDEPDAAVAAIVMMVEMVHQTVQK